MTYFNEQYAQISAGTLTTQNVVFDPTVTENILGVVYTGFTTNLQIQSVNFLYNNNTYSYLCTQL